MQYDVAYSRADCYDFATEDILEKYKQEVIGSLADTSAEFYSPVSVRWSPICSSALVIADVSVR